MILDQTVYPVPPTARIVRPLGKDSILQAESNMKRWGKGKAVNLTDEQKAEQKKERKRENMARYRASTEEQLKIKMLMDETLTLLCGKPHSGVMLARRLGVKVRTMAGILANMSKAGMIKRKNRQSPWEVA